jgi:hypothetical protein
LTKYGNDNEGQGHHQYQQNNPQQMPTLQQEIPMSLSQQFDHLGIPWPRY